MSVITSYSIHYTKLYESTPEEAEKAVELLDGRKLYGRNIRVSLKLRPGAAKKNTIKRYTRNNFV